MTTTQTTATRSPLHPVLTARRLNRLQALRLPEMTDLGLVNLWLEVYDMLWRTEGDAEFTRIRQRMTYLKDQVEREQLRRQP